MRDRPPPPLNFVRSFECSARHLSFTRAAEELGFTQAAISQHIRALETYLGAALFHRYPRSLALTETGEAFLPTLRQGLQLIDEATETVVAGNLTRTVAISCPMSLAENWLARQVAGFRVEHPDIEVVVHGTIWDAMAVPSADLVISMNRHDDAPAGATRILRQPLSLVAAPEWAEKISTPGELARCPLITVLGRQEYWSAFVREAGLIGLDLSGSIRTNSTNIALEMAASGAGIAATPRDLAATYVEREILIELFDLHPQSPWSYYLHSTGARFKGPTEKLRDWLVAQAA